MKGVCARNNHMEKRLQWETFVKLYNTELHSKSYTKNAA